MRFVYLACTVFVTGALIGCNDSSEPPTASVSGVVTFNGQTLDHGRVVLIHESGHGVAAPIGPDGKYTLEARVGANAVLIECPQPDADATVPGRPGMTMPVSMIPTRYTKHSTSGLTVDVSSEGTQRDSDLDS